jgi:hypothetical protein
MQKPPPSNEEIVNVLWDIWRRVDKDSPQDRQKIYAVIDTASKAFGKPRDLQQLLTDLETQQHIMKAAGWSGVANLMLDAARRLHEFCRAGHSQYLQGRPLPLSDENLAREVIRYMPVLHIEKESDAGRVFCEAARRLSERSEQLEASFDKPKQSAANSDKPNSETEISESIKMSDVPAILQEISSYASCAQIAFLDDHSGAGRDFVFKANMRLQNIVALLRIETAESLIDG